MFTKILLASDGSERAIRSAQAAAALARKFDAAITVLHVFAVSPAVAALYGVPGIGLGPGEISVLETEAHNDVLGRTGAALDREGVAYTTRREAGHPAEVIVRIADDENFDLIVLGSRGQSGVKEFLLGSISDRVTHHARCSVLIVREQDGG